MNEPTTPPSHSRPALPDAWSRSGSIPLDGLIERNQFPPFLMATLAILAGWVLFQVVGSVGTALLLAVQDVSLSQLTEDFEQVLALHSREVLLSNSLGQVLGLALPVLLLTWLHSSRIWSFLRVRRTSAVLLGLSFLGLVALTPVVQWLASVNQSLPLPDWWSAFEESQLQLIEKVLESNLGLTFNLLMLAVTPAFCEELLFRGYAQRQFERSTGVAGGILLSGLLFGFFHFRLSQVLPLSVLGLYLAYLVWRTGSLWPAVLVHFANNAFSVSMAELVARRPDLRVSEIETMQVPWYIVVAGALGFVLVVYALHQTSQALQAQQKAHHTDRSRSVFPEGDYE